ncbi:GntR family transcriptional regulator [Brevibacillus choshinensis]|uniref:Transcriptional regulator PhoB n=1 Tax=Brevibacillus choshinensis TaxID=54911 RepID=A0ABX7FUW6_BRECH|nr:GntR family transcriptional regulator [Brevibacillus choshinensis]QRG70051.1 transcriptional regulator PhoB [Brevibacillus choshinensis]
MKLNNASLKPLYIQLMEVLKEDVNRGVYKVGQQLPPEGELCEMYGVSRITTRRAITELVEAGILQRQQGKGTFVTASKLKRELIAVNGFSEFLTQTGKMPQPRIISTTILEVDEAIAAPLQIPPGTSTLQLKRLHYVNDTPLVWETVYYPLTRFPDLEKHIAESISTYQVLKKYYDIQPASNLKTLNVIMATQEEAQLLRCSIGSPLYQIDKVAYDEQGTPFHSSSSLIPTDRVTFTINTGQNRSN